MTSETTDNPQPPDGSTAEEVTAYLDYLDQRDNLDRSAKADTPDERRRRNGPADTSTAGQASHDPDLYFIGTVGEFGVAKVFGWPKPSLHTFYDPSLPFQIHVRTRPKIAHDMIVRDADSPNDVFVKTIVAPPVVELVGWLPGRECRRAEWRHRHGGAMVWFVPSDALRDMSELVKLVEKWRRGRPTGRQPRK